MFNHVRPIEGCPQPPKGFSKAPKFLLLWEFKGQREQRWLGLQHLLSSMFLKLSLSLQSSPSSPLYVHIFFSLSIFLLPLMQSQRQKRREVRCVLAWLHTDCPLLVWRGSCAQQAISSRVPRVVWRGTLTVWLMVSEWFTTGSHVLWRQKQQFAFKRHDRIWI